ncbi:MULTISPECIES: DUF6213 family protein [Kitasatospora]|uniref:Uncharacterized protein n=1 Tax=Kitasatospora cystarginea TaxID=58350 RepID=A0ABP5RY52_9ACTN
MNSDLEESDGQRFRLPVYRLDGELVIPAIAVTDMLRGIAELWETWRRSDQHRMDDETTAVLCTALERFADQLDTECIAVADPRPTR